MRILKLILKMILVIAGGSIIITGFTAFARPETAVIMLLAGGGLLFLGFRIGREVSTSRLSNQKVLIKMIEKAGGALEYDIPPIRISYQNKQKEVNDHEIEIVGAYLSDNEEGVYIRGKKTDSDTMFNFTISRIIKTLDSSGNPIDLFAVLMSGKTPKR